MKKEVKAQKEVTYTQELVAVLVTENVTWFMDSGEDLLPAGSKVVVTHYFDSEGFDGYTIHRQNEDGTSEEVEIDDWNFIPLHELPFDTHHVVIKTVEHAC